MTEWMPEMTLPEWLEYGRKRDWISPAFCDVHDVLPLSNIERDLLESGSDPCVTVVRIYENRDQKIEVEKDNP